MFCGRAGPASIPQRRKCTPVGCNYIELFMIRNFSIHSKTWYFFATGLKVLYRRRKAIEKKGSSDFEIAAINSSILLHLSATIEGAVNSLMFIHLASNQDYKNAKYQHNIEIVRLFQSQINQLQKATWSKLTEDISKTVLGFPLSEVYEKDWHAVKYLFDFRNILAHGGIIVRSIDKISTDEVFSPDTIEETEEYITKRDLFEYLHKKKLIGSFDDRGFFDWKFINSKVIDFFYFHTKGFLTSLYAEYLKKNKLPFLLENDKIAIGKL